MTKGIHKVVLYVHEKSKRFTITARMERARLPGVDEQMARKGYARTIVEEGLEKHKAEEMRDRIREEYEAKGYTYQTRLALS